ncbi:DUF3861 domain-containing protein [Edaphobacter flagellatus]|uniref:DUF3861 domain-containing protein n=1 Tax=Edaphobacter flagellatus TaxID=1933044 RepID=UPI0021B1DB81|nr:DUF3861 domain-containing protein [Edaphobacter flagellatus]
MSRYRYRITVEKLADAKGEAVRGQSLTFYAVNHDDILEIVEKLESRLPFDAGTAASLGVGLKLFSGVTLTYRNHPIFTDIHPALSEFIQQLKRQPEIQPAS